MSDRPGHSDVDALMDLSRELVGMAVRSLGAIDGGVTLPQWRALVVLQDLGPCSGGELAEGVGLHVSTITRLCDRLVLAELITREVRAEDRRQIELAIAPAGTALVRKVRAARKRELSEALDRLTERQRAALRDVAAPLAESMSNRAKNGISGW